MNLFVFDGHSIDLDTVEKVETDENFTSTDEELIVHVRGLDEPMVFAVNDAAGIKRQMYGAMGREMDEDDD